jgi:hypothetical protein
MMQHAAPAQLSGPNLCIVCDQDRCRTGITHDADWSPATQSLSDAMLEAPWIDVMPKGVCSDTGSAAGAALLAHSQHTANL